MPNVLEEPSFVLDVPSPLHQEEETPSVTSYLGRLVTKGFNQLKDVTKLIGTTICSRIVVAAGMHLSGVSAPQNPPIPDLTAGKVICGAVFEEVVFRGLIQEGVLRQLPKELLKRYFPGQEGIVDAIPFRICRVALSSLLFALAHTPQWSASLIQCSHQIAGGAIKGYFVETRGPEGLIVCAIAHSALNLVYLSLLKD